MELLLSLVAAAFLGATISGVFGMAGGSVFLGLMLVVGLPHVVAVPVHAAVQLVSNGSRVYAHLENVRWKPALVLFLTALPGPIIGMHLLASLDPEYAKLIIGGLIIYAVWFPKWGLNSIPDTPAFALAGVAAGILGVVVGAVGPLIAPFFLRPSFEKEQIIATKALCQALIHVIKTLAFLGLYPTIVASKTIDFSYLDYAHLIIPMAAVTILGTYLGKWLLKRISKERFVLGYKVVLTLLATELIVSSLA